MEMMNRKSLRRRIASNTAAPGPRSRSRRCEHVLQYTRVRKWVSSDFELSMAIEDEQSSTEEHCLHL